MTINMIKLTRNRFRYQKYPVENPTSCDVRGGIYNKNDTTCT